MNKTIVLLKFSILVLMLSITASLCGQDTSSIQKEGPFLKGIFLEDVNLLVPWGATIEEVAKFGNPQIDGYATLNKMVVISWHSAKILNNIHANLTFSLKRTKGAYSKLNDMYIFIDIADIQKAYDYVEKCSGPPDRITYRLKLPSYWWKFEKYWIQFTKGPYAGVFLVQANIRGM